MLVNLKKHCINSNNKHIQIYMAQNLDIKEIIHEHFKPIFFAYDKDHSSTLEKEELKALLADNLGVDKEDITPDQLDWHFDRID